MTHSDPKGRERRKKGAYFKARAGADRRVRTFLDYCQRMCDSTEQSEYTELDNTNSISTSFHDFQSKIAEFVAKYHDLFA